MKTIEYFGRPLAPGEYLKLLPHRPPMPHNLADCFIRRYTSLSVERMYCMTYILKKEPRLPVAPTISHQFISA